jgi:hypothetical protein
MTYPHAVTIRLWEPIQPIARGERYEDPLHEALTAAKLGEIDGGGSQLGPEGEILYAELAAYLADLDGAVGLARRMLEQAGAADGSEFLFATETGRPPVRFGTQQALALYLDGVGLPDEVYANLDFDALVTELQTALGVPMRETWMGPAETGLYFYGPDAEALFRRGEAVLRRLPICQNARVVLRHGHDSLNPRTIRLPRH